MRPSPQRYLVPDVTMVAVQVGACYALPWLWTLASQASIPSARPTQWIAGGRITPKADVVGRACEEGSDAAYRGHPRRTFHFFGRSGE